MHTFSRFVVRFVALSFCVWIALSLLGCGASYEIIPTASYLPSSEQVERDRQLLAIPPDLQERLNAVVARSGGMAQQGANRQFIGQMPSPEMLLHRELLKTLLGWANEKTPDERLQEQAEVMQRQSEGAVLEDWRVQRAAGTVAGAAIGTVPLGPYAADVAIELKVLPKGTYHAQVGRACGEIISGVIQMVGGCTGAAGGMTASGTGGGAVVGIPLVMASVAVAGNGYATAVHGLDEAQRLWNEGPPADDVPRSVPEEPLLKPKAQPEPPAPVVAAPAPTPAAPAPAPVAAKPSAPAAPAQTRTTTRNKTTGVTESHSESGTTTTSRPKKAPAQAGADVKPKASDAPKATTPYARPSGATTPAQRASVQGKPCVDCGAVAPRQVADHKKPLVREHYETGAIDKSRMRSNDAVQPQCPTCSARQGAEMSQYSREQRQLLKDKTP